MKNKALVVIDLQNGITKNDREIMETTNQAIDWAAANNIDIGVLFMYCNLLTGIFTIFAIVMLHLQILQEERHLSAAFGAEYLAYRQQVLRYLGRRKGEKK